jgi:hypothetical protein
MKRLLLIILFLLPISALAVTAKPTFWYNTRGLTTYTPANASFMFSNVDAACRNYYDSTWSTSSILNGFSVSGATPTLAGNCYLNQVTRSTGAANNQSIGIQTVLTCPAGFTLNFNNTNYALSTCNASACPSGMTANSSGDCIDNCAVLKDQTTSLGVNCSASSFPSAVCLPNNCAATSFNAAMGFDKTKNCYFGSVTVKLTGVSCSGETSSAAFTNPTSQQPPPADTPEANCIKQGMSYGTVNGVAVCVPKSSTGATPIKQTSATNTTTTTTGTDGKQNTTTSSEVKNATQEGDQVTSQIIKNNPDGTKTETTSTMPIGEFCAQNPSHQLCKKASEDEDTSSACEDNPDLPQCFNRGEPEEGEPIGEQSKTVTFTPVSITSGGGCPADKSVSIAGRSITFSYSWLCQYASMFRPFMLAFAYLSAAMFLFWGYKGAQT